MNDLMNSPYGPMLGFLAFVVFFASAPNWRIDMPENYDAVGDDRPKEQAYEEFIRKTVPGNPFAQWLFMNNFWSTLAVWSRTEDDAVASAQADKIEALIKPLWESWDRERMAKLNAPTLTQVVERDDADHAASMHPERRRGERRGVRAEDDPEERYGKADEEFRIHGKRPSRWTLILAALKGNR